MQCAIRLLHQKRPAQSRPFSCWRDQLTRNGSLIGSRPPDLIPQRAIQIQVKRSVPAAQNARTRDRRQLTPEELDENRKALRRAILSMANS